MPWMRRLDLLLAERLQRAIAVAADVLNVRVSDGRNLRRLVDARHSELRVHRDGGDERVVSGIDLARRHPGHAREVRRNVDHGVPVPPDQRREVLRPVTVDRLQLREQPGV